MAQSYPDSITSLLNLLSNSLVLSHIAPHLPISAINALAATSHSFRSLVFSSPECFRYLDLTTVKSLVGHDAPLDIGGVSWRAERMDEALTEDEFYSGPLRGIFSKLARRHSLSCVKTLILDGLTVTADLVQQIITEDRFNVRILSIREAKHLNERKLMQVLKYAVRPTRPEGTPKLRGLYFFGPRQSAPVEPPPKNGPSRSSNSSRRQPQATQISSGWNVRSQEALNTALSGNDEKWFRSSGPLFRRPTPGSEWAETLKACEGIIFFDAVLCRGPRHNSEVVLDTRRQRQSYLPPTIANVALGPGGCVSCKSCPEGPAIFGESPTSYFPLLSPPALQASTVKACQLPSDLGPGQPAQLIVRCEHCLKGRWCERCNKFWDEDCYAGAPNGTRTELQQQELMEDMMSAAEIREQQGHLKIGVKRECFGCGFTCADCTWLYIKPCKVCKHEYCVLDNEAPSDTTCDWCHYTGRRTRELY